MEARKITIVSTRNSSKKIIETGAETLEELKHALDEAGVDYSGLTFYEGLTQTELMNNSSQLPRDVQFNGKTTNNLVFMLTNTNKKIDSGASRTELYQIIKAKGLAEACKAKYGKNFTMCKTFELENLIAETELNKPASKTSHKVTKVKPTNTATVTEECPTKKALETLVGILYDNDVICSSEVRKISAILNPENQEEQIYSDDDIDKMFGNMMK